MSEQPKTPAQETWDVLVEEFGNVRTENERGRRNKAVKQLLAAGATEEEIRIAVAYCRRNFTQFSEMAVCSWFSQALLEAEKIGQQRDTFIRLLKPKEGA